MFNKNLAMAVKVDGKVLREIDGKVYLPFGAEYTIYFKNTSTRRVKVKVTIDGKDAMDGAKLIIDANSTSELKRFIKNGNMNEGNALKFIEKTAQISKHRGDRVEDGLITVEYEFEREVPTYFRNRDYWEKMGIQPDARPAIKKGIYPGSFHSHNTYNNSLEDSIYGDHSGYASMDWSDNSGDGAATSFALNATTAIPKTVTRASAAGITAPGSHNSQQFVSSSWAGTDTSTKATMTLELKGEVEEESSTVTCHADGSVTLTTNGNVNITAESIQVQAPVTIKSKVACYMCGSEYKSGTKYCSECGTSLKIY